MKTLFLWLIRFYELGISPHLPHVCRFVPSCSVYMRECIQKKGAVKGSWQGFKRLARCHPFCKGGFDPS